MLIDVGKGFLPVWLLPAWVFPSVGLDPGVSRAWLALACGGAAICGHCYPVFFGFSGGKGAATTVGVMLAIAPGLLLPALAVWVAVVITTGFVGLATMLATAAVPAWLVVSGQTVRAELLSFSLLLTAFIAYTHRGNIRRMLERRENRLGRAMIFRRRH